MIKTCANIHGDIEYKIRLKKKKVCSILTGLDINIIILQQSLNSLKSSCNLFMSFSAIVLQAKDFQCSSKASTILYRWLLWPPPYILTSIWTKKLKSGFITPVVTDFQSNSCIIWCTWVFPLFSFLKNGILTAIF